MSPKLPGVRPTSGVTGSGPGGRVEIGDIRSKLVQIRGDADETAEEIKPKALVVAVAGAVVVVGVAFLLGRRRGRHKATWVEIKRL